MEVLVFEGPAGSGKSSRAEAMANSTNGRVFIPPLERPRDYGLSSLAMSKDFTQIAEATLDKQNNLLIFDRFWYSQYVYDFLRSGVRMTSPELHTEQLHQLVDWTKNHYFRRGYPVNNRITFRFIFVIPDYSELVHRRSVGEKEYPFSPDQEIHIYTATSSILMGLSPDARKGSTLDLHFEVWNS